MVTYLPCIKMKFLTTLANHKEVIDFFLASLIIKKLHRQQNFKFEYLNSNSLNLPHPSQWDLPIVHIWDI